MPALIGCVLIPILFGAQLVAGQDTTRVATEPQWPIDPATYPRPTHPATRATGLIIIDGRPDEAVWAEAPPITRFIQSRPDVGYLATQQTIVRVLYDNDAIYISAICFDDEPDNLTVTSLERDFPPLDSDVFSFVLDPNLDRRNAFLFYINPHGAYGDAQAFDDNRVLNYAWDGVAQVETQLTDFGWTVEIAIPLTTLRFEGAEGIQDWGFNAQRRVRRINESSTWSPLDRREYQPKVSRAGTLTGFEGLEQGRNLRVEPYVRGSVGLGSDEGAGTGDEVDGGFDLKYGLTSSLTLDATYRTDFSHVEVDQLQVNLTRFPLFFPERRNFFIENSGIFDFGDSTLRSGLNLFSDSVVALSLENGQMEWYYQLVHHDVWDYDNGQQPILFDMEVDGVPVKALAQANKNSWLYILNRETGEPVHPIIETPVPTETDREGEQPWPTQPIPHKANGERMEPVSPVFPLEIPADHLAENRLVEQFTPLGQDIIFAPGMGGGASYGPISYSSDTGLLYVNAIDQPFNSGRGPRGYFSAYDPTTGELAWRHIFEGYGQAGSVVTKGGVVFVGTGSNIAGYFFAYDAKTGEELWKYNTGSGIFASPAVYMVDGEEFVTVASGGGSRGRRGGDLILSFALPKR